MEKNSQAVIPDNIIVVEGDGLNPVPTPEAGDAGKVLGVLNSSGDIGWVEDQGGTLTQIQSDWAETDSSKVSYIDHKPDLSVYATTSAVNTALAGKQDTISDLSDIRSGAAKGDTAVQPATLESYATTSAMNTALADKQDVISDLSDIRSGAALGATAVQPADMPSSDELVPSASSGDAGKVLTVDSQGEPQWVTPSGGVTYSAGDGIDIDANNVISADVDGSTIGIDSTTKKIKLLSTIPSVDQTYNAVSTNAQSGVAVAQAIAAIPSSSYTAGDAIDITNNEISVDYDTDTLDMVYSELTVNMAQSVSSGTLSIPSEIQALAAGSSPTTVKIHIPANTLYLMGSWTSHPLRIAFCASNYIKNDEEGDFAQFTSIAVSCTYEESDNYTWIDEQDIKITLPCNSLNGWSSSVTPVKFTISVDENDGNAYLGSLSIGNGTTLSNPVVFSYPSTSATQVLSVKNPVPASTQADYSKVLKVNASGNAEWGTDGFTTTAGITDIQQVAALPANPVATVLYLIPET